LAERNTPKLSTTQPFHSSAVALKLATPRWLVKRGGSRFTFWKTEARLALSCGRRCACCCSRHIIIAGHLGAARSSGSRLAISRSRCTTACASSTDRLGLFAAAALVGEGGCTGGREVSMDREAAAEVDALGAAGAAGSGESFG
jgi:hypothetical protein